MFNNPFLILIPFFFGCWMCSRNSKLLPGQIDSAIAGKVFDSVMALAEKQPAKFLKSYDKRFFRHPDAIPQANAKGGREGVCC